MGKKSGKNKSTVEVFCYNFFIIVVAAILSTIEMFWIIFFLALGENPILLCLFL